MAKDANGLHIPTEQELAAQLAAIDAEGDKKGDPDAPDEEDD